MGILEERSDEPGKRSLGRGWAAVWWAVALAVVALSLWLRVVHRGPYIPGWDVLGASAGLMYVTAEPPAEFFRQYRSYRTAPYPAWNVITVPATLVPGLLAYVHPWEYWPHVVTFTLFVTGLLVLGRGLDLGLREAFLLLLAWAASSTLMSLSLMGFPYVTNTLPFAVALWTVLRRRHWLVTLLLGALTTEIAWNVQELGRTVSVVFLAAAFLLPDASWPARIVWLATGVAQALLSMWAPSFNTAHYAAMTLPSLAHGLETAGELAWLFLLQRPDLFVVLPITACVVWWSGPARWFWLAIVGAQAGLIFLLAANSGTMQGISGVWPRRTTVLTFVCIGAVLAAYRHMERGRPWVRRALLAGALLQLGHTAAWAARPLNANNAAAGFTLPYTESTLDMLVSFFSVDWYREMRERVDARAQLLLLYNLSSYDENATNPVGIPERLHLHLGHEAFMRQVLMFGDAQVRWAKVPIRPLSDMGPVLDGLARPEAVEGYWMHHDFDERTDWPGAQIHRNEIDAMLREIQARFVIDWQPEEQRPGGQTLRRFRLRPRESSRQLAQ